MPRVTRDPAWVRFVRWLLWPLFRPPPQDDVASAPEARPLATLSAHAEGLLRDEEQRAHQAGHGVALGDAVAALLAAWGLDDADGIHPLTLNAVAVRLRAATQVDRPAAGEFSHTVFHVRQSTAQGGKPEHVLAFITDAASNGDEHAGVQRILREPLVASLLALHQRWPDGPPPRDVVARAEDAHVVRLFNDDVTTQHFVLAVLTEELGMPEDNAVALMLQVHERGSATTPPLGRTEAVTVCHAIKARAQQQGSPLWCAVEPLGSAAPSAR